MLRPVGLFVAAVLCLSLEGCSNEVPRTVTAVGRATVTAPKQDLSVPKAAPRQTPVQTREPLPFTFLVGGGGHADDRLVVDLVTALERNGLRLQLRQSKGPEQDLLALLHNPGIDVALIPMDAIEALPRRMRAGAQDNLRYLFRAPGQRLHILARRDITTIHDLDGRKINISQPGDGTALTTRLIFDKLGIKAEFTSDDPFTASQRLRSNEIQAIVLLASDTSKDILAFESGGNFHLVPVPFQTVAAALEDLIVHYSPSQLTDEEYPYLVNQSQPVETIAVNRVLALRNWPEGSAPYQRLADLSEALSTYLFDEFQKPAGNEIDPAEQAIGWKRFRPTEILLARRAQQVAERRSFEEFAAAQSNCSLPDTAARERLYNDFLAWRKAREPGPNAADSAPDKK